MSPAARKDQPHLTAAFWVTIVIALVPAVCGMAVTSYIAAQADRKIDTVKVEMKAELSATEGRLGEKIRQIDVNSADRRNESQAEMMRLDESRAQQVMQLRQDLREHIQGESR